MTSRTTFASRQILAATLTALLSGTAASTPFDPSQPMGPVMKGLLSAAEQAQLAKTPRSAALIDTSQLPGNLFNPENKTRRYSSIWSNQDTSGRYANSQLNSTQAWSAAVNNSEQWLELPIPQGENAIGIATQGRANANQWVKKYKVLARLPGGTLLPLHGQSSLAGNKNRNSIVHHPAILPMVKIKATLRA